MALEDLETCFEATESTLQYIKNSTRYKNKQKAFLPDVYLLAGKNWLLAFFKCSQQPFELSGLG